LRKLWFAALIAAALAVVTAALPVIANQKNATDAVKSRAVSDPATSGPLPSYQTSKTPSATVPPKPNTIETDSDATDSRA
jgi:hypothetical protein